MKVLAWLALIAVGLYMLHRLALWAESHGYIYYVNTEPSRNSIGNAFLEAQSLIEPDKRALVQVIREERSEQSESGAPPEPGEFTPEDSEELQS